MKKRHIFFIIFACVWNSFIPIMTYLNGPQFLGSGGFNDMATKWALDMIYPTALYYGVFIYLDRRKKKQQTKTPI